MLSIKKLDNVYLKIVAVLAFTGFVFLVGPDIGLAAESTANVQKKLKSGATAFQTVLTGIVAVVGIAAGLKIVVKHLPSIDDPHVKNEMWKSLGGVLAAMGASAALVWAIPWVYSLFK
ncbi:CagC family type IV secretion system protein [Peribacillus muralis]|uniref:CagC family type IV secretion system protein n=1 Tax=Peribacillus muralis TaxID=264697 RepID=UPI001F4E50FD|nr:CagC family type IV secretion system protein [Peribacillus muralis]MCK1995454.1 CagC family type IV secretion system protein [Peribacillus muralis]MCK2016037.1 CagC family type IV secretion system protein [Peribacillus muralis]